MKTPYLFPVFSTIRRFALGAALLTATFAAPSALAESTTAPAAEHTTPSASLPPNLELKKPEYHLGAHAELDLGTLFALRQGAAFAGGVVWGPFRAGMSYATFLSNSTFGGTPEGFTMRANYIVGFNASYFIGKSTDEGLYVQAMFHIKQQGVTNNDNGAHKDLNSLASGLELGYVWKVYQGLYVAPRIGALYYLKSPQGKDNDPVSIGGREYDNDRHKVFDTYLIPTLSLGYSW
jgi:hypothetical protein